MRRPIFHAFLVFVLCVWPRGAILSEACSEAEIAGALVGTDGPVTRYEIATKDGLPTDDGFWGTCYFKEGVSASYYPSAPEFSPVRDLQGKFLISNLSMGDKTLFVKWDQYRYARFEVKGLGETERRTDIKLSAVPLIVLNGKIQDSSGKPIVGAWVFLGTLNRDLLAYPSRNAICRTDQNGQYEFHVSPCKIQYTSFCMKGFAPQIVQSNSQHAAIVTMVPGAAVSGVLSLGGTPMSDQLVSFKHLTSSDIVLFADYAYTDANGGFTMTDLPLGMGKISVSVETADDANWTKRSYERVVDTKSSISLRADINFSNGDTTLCLNASMKGRELNTVNALITEFAGDVQESYVFCQRISTRGSLLTLGGLPPGKCVVFVDGRSAEAVASEYLTFNIAEHGTQNVDLQLDLPENLSVVYGRVLSARGQEAVDVYLFPSAPGFDYGSGEGSGMQVRACNTDMNNRFVIEAVPAGNYRLVARAYVPTLSACKPAEARVSEKEIYVDQHAKEVRVDLTLWDK